MSTHETKCKCGYGLAFPEAEDGVCADCQIKAITPTRIAAIRARMEAAAGGRAAD